MLGGRLSGGQVPLLLTPLLTLRGLGRNYRDNVVFLMQCVINMSVCYLIISGICIVFRVRYACLWVGTRSMVGLTRDEFLCCKLFY